LEPDIGQTVRHTARIFFKYTLHQMLLKAKASEQSARMVAITNATDNAESFPQELKLEHNKAHQDAIMNEIMEFAASAMESSWKSLENYTNHECRD
jgi:F-type H+-transporting ATPase subunit gamma